MKLPRLRRLGLCSSFLLLWAAHPASAATVFWEKVVAHTDGSTLEPGELQSYSLHLQVAPPEIQAFRTRGGPSAVAGLRAWYAPDSGFEEGVWRDLSSAGNDALADSPNHAPASAFVYRYRTLCFDGTDDRLTASGIDGSSLGRDSGYTLFLVISPFGDCRPDRNADLGPGPSPAMILSLRPRAGTSDRSKIQIAQQAGSPRKIFSLSNGVGSPSETVALTGLAVLIERVEAGTHGARITLRSFDTVASHSAGDTADIDDRAEGYSLTIGGGPNDDPHFSGQIGEILLYGRALAWEEAGRIAAWLGKKWQINTSYRGASLLEPESIGYTPRSVQRNCTAASRCVKPGLQDLVEHCGGPTPTFDVETERCMPFSVPDPLTRLELRLYMRAFKNDASQSRSKRSGYVVLRPP